MKLKYLIALFLTLLIGLGIWKWMSYETNEFPSAIVFESAVMIDFTPINKFTKSNLAKKWTFIGSCSDKCSVILDNLNYIYSELVKKNVLIHAKYKLETQFVILNSQPNKNISFNKNFTILNNNLTNTISLYTEIHSEHLTSANILLFDTFGRLRAVFSPPFNPNQLVKDFINIRDKYAEKCCIIPDKQPNRVRFNYKE